MKNFSVISYHCPHVMVLVYSKQVIRHIFNLLLLSPTPWVIWEREESPKGGVICDGKTKRKGRWGPQAFSGWKGAQRAGVGSRSERAGMCGGVCGASPEGAASQPLPFELWWPCCLLCSSSLTSPAAVGCLGSDWRRTAITRVKACGTIPHTV